MNTARPPEVRVSRRYAHAPERVFDAWLDPGSACKWLFATPTGRMVRAEIDPRVGGKFVLTDRRDGEDVEHAGEYLEIDRPRRLGFTFSVPKYSSDAARVRIEIAVHGDGCELTLSQEIQPAWADLASSIEAGWTGILAGLAAALGEPGPAAK